MFLSSPDRTDHEKRCVNLALADVNTDCGLSFSENSFKSHLEEPGILILILLIIITNTSYNQGVGNDDRY